MASIKPEREKKNTQWTRCVGDEEVSNEKHTHTKNVNTADWAKLLDVLRTITACPLPPPPPPPAPLPLLQRWKVFLSAEICLKKKHAIHMNNSNNSRGYIIMLENESLKDKKKKRDMEEKKKRVNFGGFTFLVLSRFLSICTVYSVGFCGKGGKKAAGSFFFFRWASKKKKKRDPIC